MPATVSKSKSTLGFLTVVADPQHGLFGGYLVLSTAGRPLEFHCTAPIKPNRAQEILYGPTLEPYLYGEQIGQTLLSKSQAGPLVVCTDLAPVLAVREHVAVPVVLVLAGAPPAPAEQGPDRTWRLDEPHAGGARWNAFAWGRHHLAVAREAPDDRTIAAERLAVLDESFDLAEPFSRIREAIEEARRGG